MLKIIKVGLNDIGAIPPSNFVRITLWRAQTYLSRFCLESPTSAGLLFFY